MVDLIYNAITRPIANEPDKKDIYHVDKANRDQKAKRIEDDDPQSQSQSRSNQEQEENQRQQKQLDKRLEKHQEGKGKYVDEDGVEHLDIFV
jgi:predicted GIY-YIG superfamily endonuclease